MKAMKKFKIEELSTPLKDALTAKNIKEAFLVVEGVAVKGLKLWYTAGQEVIEMGDQIIWPTDEKFAELKRQAMLTPLIVKELGALVREVADRKALVKVRIGETTVVAEKLEVEDGAIVIS